MVSPFLGMGVTYPIFQASGILLVERLMERLNIKVICSMSADSAVNII